MRKMLLAVLGFALAVLSSPVSAVEYYSPVYPDRAEGRAMGMVWKLKTSRVEPLCEWLRREGRYSGNPTGCVTGMYRGELISGNYVTADKIDWGKTSIRPEDRLTLSVPDKEVYELFKKSGTLSTITLSGSAAPAQRAARQQQPTQLAPRPSASPVVPAPSARPQPLQKQAPVPPVSPSAVAAEEEKRKLEGQISELRDQITGLQAANVKLAESNEMLQQERTDLGKSVTNHDVWDHKKFWRMFWQIVIPAAVLCLVIAGAIGYFLRKPQVQGISEIPEETQKHYKGLRERNQQLDQENARLAKTNEFLEEDIKELKEKNQGLLDGLRATQDREARAREALREQGHEPPPETAPPPVAATSVQDWSIEKHVPTTEDPGCVLPNWIFEPKDLPPEARTVKARGVWRETNLGETSCDDLQNLILSDLDLMNETLRALGLKLRTNGKNGNGTPAAT